MPQQIDAISEIKHITMKKQISLFFILVIYFTFNLFAQTNSDNSLIAYYPFNGNTNDESGNNNHGTLKGNTTLSEDRNGNTNEALYFDGSNSWVELTDFNLGQNLSIAFWVNPHTTSNAAFFQKTTMKLVPDVRIYC